MAQGQVVNIADAYSDPYRLRKPVFDFADKRAADFDVDTISAPELLKSIERQNAEILQILAPLTEQVKGESKSAKPLWFLFWVCQIIGLISLVIAELTEVLAIRGDLKLLGLSLTFIALESAFLAQFAERWLAKHAKEGPV